MRDQRAVPHAVQVAGIVAAGLRAEDRDRNVVAAVADAQRVERLVEIADEVHQELERDRPVGAIERRVREPRLVVEDPIDRRSRARCRRARPRRRRLPRAVAIAIVAGRVGRNVEEVPVERLVVPFEIPVRPRRHVGERLRPEQPGDVAARDRRQALGGQQRDEPMPLPAPRLDPRRRGDRQQQDPGSRRTAPRHRARHFAGARFSGQLDVGAPRIGEERDRRRRVRNLRVRPIELDAGRLELLAERLEVLHLEAEVIERAPLRADGRRVGLRERQVHARQIGGVELPALPGTAPNVFAYHACVSSGDAM